jgi:flagellar biosynthesis protein
LATPKDRPPPRSAKPRLLEHRRPSGAWPEDRSGDGERPARRDLVVEGPSEGAPRPAYRGRPERQVAIALQHEMSWPGAPRVVATGWGETARKILETAFANNVKVREDPDLARILAAVELDSEIPLEAFTAVAEILAYVYKANGKLPPSGGGAAR